MSWGEGEGEEGCREGAEAGLRNFSHPARFLQFRTRNVKESSSPGASEGESPDSSTAVGPGSWGPAPLSSWDSGSRPSGAQRFLDTRLVGFRPFLPWRLGPCWFWGIPGKREGLRGWRLGAEAGRSGA